MARFVVREGPQAGEVFELGAGQQIVGRSEECPIRLNDPSVSRQHAVIVGEDGGEFTIRDASSSYGTFVNGNQTQYAKLYDKALVKIGNSMLEFESGDAQRAADSFGLRRDAGADAGFSTIVHVIPQRRADDRGRVLGGSTGERHLRAAYEISAALSATFDRDVICRKILDVIFATMPAERGAVLLLDEATGELRCEASKDAFGRDQKIAYSQTIAQHVLTHGESVLFSDAQGDEALSPSQSIILDNIRSAMCVPVRAHEKIVGALNVDASGSALFNKDDLQLLTIIGNEAGMMIENARLAEENIRAARLAAVGQTVAGLAHCIKNIVQGLKGGSFLVDQALLAGDAAQIAEAWPLVKHSQQRITELVMNMLDYSKERKPAYQRACMREHLHNIHALMRERAAEKGVAIEFAYDEAMPPIECDPLAIYRAVLNLMTNAIDAAEAGGRVVRLQAGPAPDGQNATITVADNGPGIPAAMRGKLFEAFQSTKNSKGTGLGLAVVKKIVDEHRGRVHVQTAENEGCSFTIVLPIDKPA